MRAKKAPAGGVPQGRRATKGDPGPAASRPQHVEEEGHAKDLLKCAAKIKALFVESSFKDCHRSDPWQKTSQRNLLAAQCYSLAVRIMTIKRRAGHQDYQHADPSFAGRLGTVNKMKKLIEYQKKRQLLLIEEHKRWQLILVEDDQESQPPGDFPEAERQAIAQLDALRAALAASEEALLWPFDPSEGERSGAWWHKAGRMVADGVAEILRQADVVNISNTKNGPYVSVIVGALQLAKITVTPGAVEALLARRTS